MSVETVGTVQWWGNPTHGVRGHPDGSVDEIRGIWCRQRNRPPRRRWRPASRWRRGSASYTVALPTALGVAQFRPEPALRRVFVALRWNSVLTRKRRPVAPLGCRRRAGNETGRPIVQGGQCLRQSATVSLCHWTAGVRHQPVSFFVLRNWSCGRGCDRATAAKVRSGPHQAARNCLAMLAVSDRLLANLRYSSGRLRCLPGQRRDPRCA